VPWRPATFLMGNGTALRVGYIPYMSN